MVMKYKIHQRTEYTMGFMDSYKHLEKLCGDMLGDERRISAYIDEMYENTEGWDLVDGWESDLKKLKHYRWVRNRIVHEPDAYEDELCDAEDIEWLDDFYYRIIDREDPLNRYYEIVRSRKSIKHASEQRMDSASYGKNSSSQCSDDKPGKILPGFLCFLCFFFAVVILFMILGEIL